MKTAKTGKTAERNQDLWIILGETSAIVILYIAALAVCMNFIGRAF
ncbi:MAG: hypothetical protein ACE5OP_11220 [Candidatus Glassbacteria bacterium]